jgi:hypothetical protein
LALLLRAAAAFKGGDAKETKRLDTRIP